MKKTISIVLVSALLNFFMVPAVVAEDAPSSEEMPPAEAVVVEEVAPVENEEAPEIAGERPIDEEDLELDFGESDEEELTPPPPGVTDAFTPFLDYAVDPMASKKALGNYETDLASGAATYSYPIYLPPGRNGIQPEVSLVYNNQASSADSIVGYGWSLWAGGSISRTQEYGFFEMYDTNEFYLSMSGANGKLLPISLDDDEHGEYGLQVEEAFYKYEFESDDSWVVTDQNGVKYYFGQDADSRQDDPDDSMRISEWYLDEIVNLQGDSVSFEYLEDQGRVYPQAIFYMDFEVQFELTLRDDWTKWYDKGFEVKTEYLVTGIDVYYDSSMVREYDFQYGVGENGLRAMLTSITETGTSLEGDIVTLPMTEFEYSDNGLTYGFAEYSASSADLNNAQFADINGDGFVDQGLFTNTSSSSNYYGYSALNNGNGTSFSSQYSQLYFSAGDLTSSLDTDTYFVDMNGDSLPEVLYFNDDPGDSWNCFYTNYGGGFVGDYYRCTIWDPERDVDGFRFGDFDGDGLSDLFTGDEDGVDWSETGSSIYLNDGDFGFDDSGYDSPVVFSWGDYAYPHYYEGQDSGVRLMDLNGDGLTDILQRYQDFGYDFYSTPVSSAVLKVYLNTGDGSFVEDSDFDLTFFVGSDWLFAGMMYGAYSHPSGSYYGVSSDICFQDFNGDGVLDIIDGTVVYIWDGIDGWNRATIRATDFTPTCGGLVYSTSREWAHSNSELNGDGLLDFFESEEGMATNKDVFLSTWDKPDLLTSITTSAGADIDISYQSALQYDYENPDLPFAIYTVDEVSIEDGLGGESIISYEYSGGAYYKYFDGVKGEFSKFGEVTVSEDGVTTVYTFDTGCHEGELCSNGLSDGMVVQIYGGNWYVVDGDYLRQLTICPVVAGFASDYSFGGTYRTYDTDFEDFFEMGEDWDEATDDFMYSVDYSQHALKGKLTMVEVYDDSGALYSRTVNEWSADDLGDDRYFPHVDQITTFSFEGESTARENAVSYTYNPDYGVTMTETQWGEVEADEESYEITDYMIGDEVYLSDSYAVNDTDWVVRNAEVVVVDGDGTILQDSKFYYDGDSDLGDVTDGLLTTESVWLDTDSSWLSTEYGYDSHGNVVSVTNPRGYETTIVYDDDDFYPAEIINALGQTQYFEINYSNGQPAETTDLNGYTYSYLYDGFGRVLSVTGPSVDGLSVVTHASYEYGDSSMPRYVLETLADDTSDGFNKYTYSDGLDRQVQIAVEGENEYVLSDISYTDRGEVASESLPYFESDTDVAEISYGYDALRRVTSVATDLGTTYTDYGVWEQTVTDAMGNSKSFYFDAFGSLVAVDEVNDGVTYSTYYEYDLSGRLTEVEDALGDVRGFEWDSLSRLVLQEEMHAVSDVSYALWNYEYDENGNLVSVLTPASDEIDYSYDELDRVIAEESITYVYDDAGVGFLASVTDDAGAVSYEYDVLGRVVSEVRTIGAGSFETSFVNDLLGRVSEITYPSGSVASYTFNEGGMVESVSFEGVDVISDLDYSPVGQWEEVYYGDGDSTMNTYDSAQMYFLENKLTTAVDGTVLQDISYTYDAVGNVLTISDLDITYEYDDLYRLTSAYATHLYDADYEYDEIGNMTYKSDIGDLFYDQIGDANVYAVTSAGSYVFDYDANGNVTSDGVFDYEYNYKNQMTTSSDGSEYLYDFAGMRLAKNEIYYPNMFYEEDDGIMREYVFVDGVRVFVSENELSFYQSDLVNVYTASDTDWEYIAFDRSFDAVPIVFAQVQEEVGSHSIKVDLKSIDEEGFYVMLEEDRGSDDSWLDGLHSANDVAYVAFEADNLPEGAASGVENFTGASWVIETVTFDESFSEVPVVFAQIQSENGTQTARVKILSVSETEFEMQIVEDGGNGTSGDWDGWHYAEDVAWIAFLPSENPFGGLGGTAEIGSTWEAVYFRDDSGRYRAFADYPFVFAMPVTRNEVDVCIPDIRIVYKKRFDMRLEELVLAGWDGVHADETVSWFAVGELL